MLSSWQRRAAAVAALAVPALVVAGCTSTTPGTTSPGTSTSAGTGSSPSGSAKPTSSKSARPRSIDVKNVDPCQVLSPQQRQQLGLDRPPTPGNTTAFGGDAKTCNIRESVHSTSVTLTSVTTFGIDTFTDGSRPVQSEPTQVAGFPALVVHIPNNPQSCQVAVDVADGQFFLTLFLDGPAKALSAQQVCQSAQQVAELAMASLKGGG